MPTREIDGYDLNYAEAGSGSPLVLVHGTLQDQRYWAPQMAAFAERFHVHALSLRHFWPAASSGAGDFTIARHTADVAAFIAALGGRARLVGHSRGGHIAFRVASEHPELIEALVLAEPGGELDETLGGTPPDGAQAAGFARAAAEIAAGRVAEGLRAFAHQVSGPGGFDTWLEAHKQAGFDNAATLVGHVQENRLPFSLSAARAITARTLLINGDQTRPHFIKICAALASVMPDARRVVISRATHGMSADNPAAFNAAVLRFFAGLEP